MEARARRVSGGFPGYDGPALPRAMRSHRSRGGDAAKRQGNNRPGGGVFELLATVAGQILQDAGSEDPNKSKRVQEEASKEKSQSDLDSQVTSLGSVRDFTSVDKPQSVGKRAADGDDQTNASTVEDVSVQGRESAGCGVRTPAQEEERKTFVKDVSASEGSGAVVYTNASSPEAQVTPPLCDSDMSTTLAGQRVAAPCLEMKESMPVVETVGGTAGVEQCPADEMYKAVMAEAFVSVTTVVSKQAAVEIVGETPCSEMVVDAAVVAGDKSSDSDKGSCKQLGEAETKMECSQCLDDAEAGSGLVQGGPYRASKISTNSTPEIQMQCKMSESGEYGESAEAMAEGAEAAGEDSASVELEDKGVVLVSERNQAAGAGAASSLRLACQSTFNNMELAIVSGFYSRT